MSQGDVSQLVGYAIKRAQAALNAAMEARLRGLGLGVSQYACLAQIADRPGLSNADLARAVFVSRQATHQLLGGLTASGLVELTGTGRTQGLRLTARGSTVLKGAAAAVAEVQEQMLTGLDEPDRVKLRDLLLGCADALERRSSH